MILPGAALLAWPSDRPSRSPRRMVVLAALAVVLVASVAACSPGPASHTGLGPGAPVLGSCHRLTVAIIKTSSDDAPSVSCKGPHTSVTIAVGRYLASQVTQRNASNGTLARAALAGCTADWMRTVGGDDSVRHTTIVSLAYFLPNRDQLSGGARWYRCDLVIGGQDGVPLQELPATVKGILDGTVPDSLLACRTAPSLSTGNEVACTSRHTLRAVGIATLVGGTAYPGDASLRTQSQQGCAKVVRAWLKGRIGGGIAFQWPDSTSWTLLKDHDATCWTVTTS